MLLFLSWLLTVSQANENQRLWDWWIIITEFFRYFSPVREAGKGRRACTQLKGYRGWHVSWCSFPNVALSHATELIRKNYLPAVGTERKKNLVRCFLSQPWFQACLSLWQKGGWWADWKTTCASLNHRNYEEAVRAATGTAQNAHLRVQAAVVPRSSTHSLASASNPQVPTCVGSNRANTVLSTLLPPLVPSNYIPKLAPVSQRACGTSHLVACRTMRWNRSEGRTAVAAR